MPNRKQSLGVRLRLEHLKRPLRTGKIAKMDPLTLSLPGSRFPHP